MIFQWQYHLYKVKILQVLQHRKFAAYDVTDIAILYLLTEGLRGMKFPLSTIYAT